MRKFLLILFFLFLASCRREATDAGAGTEVAGSSRSDQVTLRTTITQDGLALTGGSSGGGQDAGEGGGQTTTGSGEFVVDTFFADSDGNRVSSLSDASVLRLTNSLETGISDCLVYKDSTLRNEALVLSVLYVVQCTSSARVSVLATGEATLLKNLTLSQLASNNTGSGASLLCPGGADTMSLDLQRSCR